MMAHPAHPNHRVLVLEDCETALVDAITDLLLICGSRTRVEFLISSAFTRSGEHYDAERSGFSDIAGTEIFIQRAADSPVEPLSRKRRAPFAQLT